LIVLLGCAPPPQAQRTIELPEPGTSETPGGEEPGLVDSSSAAESGDQSGFIAGEDRPAHEDTDFVYSREPREAPRNVLAIPIHINDAWWPFRAKSLGISVAQAKRRDAAMSMHEAPKDFWDAQTALEAVSVWTVLCNECHGGRRSLQEAQTMPVPAPAWGHGEGLFFGNRRTYRHVFDIVYNGGPEQDGVRSEMIAWKRELSREMIWALLYFLEYQSGGIEGRFPPSLYPRRSEEVIESFNLSR
jgi:hypothetical protein